MQKKYSSYDIVDFLADEDFKSWILTGKTDQQLSKLWKDVAEGYPEKMPLMEAAESMIHRMPKPNGNRRVPDPDLLWDRIQTEIEGTAPKSAKRYAYILNSYWVRAAILVLVAGITAAILWLRMQSGYVEVLASKGGQLVLLPDSSKVYLGANARLRYKMEPGKIREVWLDGYGYLDVTHLNRSASRIKDQERFVVHPADGPDVWVLGTTFEVNSKAEGVEVALKSGSIQLELPDGFERLKPGDRGWFDKKRRVYQSVAASDVEIDWQSGELNLKNASLAEVAEVITDVFGKKLVVSRQAWERKKLEGSIPFDSGESAVQALKEIVGASILERDGVYYLQ